MPRSSSAVNNKRSLATESEMPARQKRAKKITIERLLKVIKNGQVEQLQEIIKDEAIFFAELTACQWNLIFNAAADNCRIDELEALLHIQSTYTRSLTAPIVYSRVLRSACIPSDLELMKLALQRGALVDSAGEDDGLSCLHIAAELRNLEAMQLLLNNGADINKCTSPNNKRLPNYTALRRSCVLGYREVIGFLLEHGAAICVGGRNALVDAAHNKPILETIVKEYGINIDITDEYGQTALWQACFNVDYGLIALLECGANPNISARTHNTPTLEPLLPSICNKDTPSYVVQFLLSHAAAVDAVDSQGEPPYFMHVRAHIITQSNFCSSTVPM